MKKVFAILTAAVMLTTVSFAQQSQNSKDTSTHKSSTTTTHKSGHTTHHSKTADTTATKSSTKKP